VSEFDMTYRGAIDGAGPQIENRTTPIIGIGDKTISAEPVELFATPGVSAAGSDRRTLSGRRMPAAPLVISPRRSIGRRHCREQWHDRARPEQAGAGALLR
jgi:hypothetical protein